MANTDNVKMAQMQYFGQEFKKEMDKSINAKASKANTLSGYGITDAYTKGEADTELKKKANSATTLAGYGITDAYTKEDANVEFNKKADSASTLAGYGITDAYTTEQTDAAIATAVSNAGHLKKEIVTAEQIASFETDPTTAAVNTIYLLEVTSVDGEDKFKEYQRIGDTFRCTGTTSTDLSGYVKSSDLHYATNDDVDVAIRAIFGTSDEE